MAAGKLAALILAAAKKPQEAPGNEDGEDSEEALEEAMRGLSEALRAGDAKAAASAFRSAIQISEAAPQAEAGEAEGEE